MITFSDKEPGDLFTAADCNELKDGINTNAISAVSLGNSISGLQSLIEGVQGDVDARSTKVSLADLDLEFEQLRAQVSGLTGGTDLSGFSTQASLSNIEGQLSLYATKVSLGGVDQRVSTLETSGVSTTGLATQVSLGNLDTRVQTLESATDDDSAYALSTTVTAIDNRLTTAQNDLSDLTTSHNNLKDDVDGLMGRVLDSTTFSIDVTNVYELTSTANVQVSVKKALNFSNINFVGGVANKPLEFYLFHQDPQGQIINVGGSVFGYGGGTPLPSLSPGWYVYTNLDQSGMNYLNEYAIILVTDSSTTIGTYTASTYNLWDEGYGGWVNNVSNTGASPLFTVTYSDSTYLNTASASGQFISANNLYPWNETINIPGGYGTNPGTLDIKFNIKDQLSADISSIELKAVSGGATDVFAYTPGTEDGNGTLVVTVDSDTSNETTLKGLQQLATRFGWNGTNYVIESSSVQNPQLEIVYQQNGLNNDPNTLSYFSLTQDYQADLLGPSASFSETDLETYLNGNLDTHIIPTTNATYDLGSAEKKIRHMYISSNSIKIGDDDETTDEQLTTINKQWFLDRGVLQEYTIENLPSKAVHGQQVIVTNGDATGEQPATAFWYKGKWMRSSDSALIADKTIDIYLIAGQSNAHGHAQVTELTAEQATQEGLFYTSWHQGTSNASSDQYYSDWATSVIAGETRGDDNNPILGGSQYFGPEIGFASKANELGLTNRGFGIIKHAIGASTLIDDPSDTTGGLSDWDLTGEGPRRGDAYRAFKSAIADALVKLEAQGYGYNLKGLIWWQGESNITGATYQDLIDFIADFRNYLDTTYTLSIPKEEFPVVITGTTSIWGTDFEAEVANKDNYIGFVNAEDYGQTAGAGIHVGSTSDNPDRNSSGVNDMFEIGEAYASQMEDAQAGATPGWVPDVTNVNLWVNADDDTTITVDSGTGYVTQVNSVTASNYFVPSSGSTIQHVEDTLLGRKVLRFSGGTGDFTGSSLEDNSAWTPDTGTQDWFIVVKPTINNAQDVIMGIQSGRDVRLMPSTSNRLNWFWNVPGGSNTYIGNLISPTDVSGSAVLLTTRLDFANNQISAWCNGTQTYSNVAVPTNLTYDLSTSVKFCLMQQINNRYRVDGDLYEVITTTSLADRVKIEGYLAWKWGLDGLLPASHQYKTISP